MANPNKIGGSPEALAMGAAGVRPLMDWEIRWLTEPVGHLPPRILDVIWRPSFWRQHHDARAREVVRLFRLAGWSYNWIEAEMLHPVDLKEVVNVH